MRYFLLLLAVAATGCVSHSDVFKSPFGGVVISHDLGSRERGANYRIVADGRDLGSVKSIINEETVRNVPGLPRSQEVFWSPSGRTALIHEDISDASPDYQHILIRISPGSESFQANRIDFGRRHSFPEDIYGHGPSVKSITDEEVDLKWATKPEIQKVEIDDVLSGSKPISIQGGSSDAERPPN